MLLLCEQRVGSRCSLVLGALSLAPDLVKIFNVANVEEGFEKTAENGGFEMTGVSVELHGTITLPQTASSSSSIEPAPQLVCGRSVSPRARIVVAPRSADLRLNSPFRQEDPLFKRYVLGRSYHTPDYWTDWNPFWAADCEKKTRQHHRPRPRSSGHARNQYQPIRVPSTANVWIGPSTSVRRTRPFTHPELGGLLVEDGLGGYYQCMFSNAVELRFDRHVLAKVVVEQDILLCCVFFFRVSLGPLFPTSAMHKPTAPNIKKTGRERGRSPRACARGRFRLCLSSSRQDHQGSPFATERQRQASLCSEKMAVSSCMGCANMYIMSCNTCLLQLHNRIVVALLETTLHELRFHVP